MTEAAYSISKARTQMLLRYPFFGALALYLVTEKDNRISLMGTDGNKLFYNPTAIQELVLKEGLDCLIGTIMHEVLHPIFQHIWRKGARDLLLWNAACDYVVNLIVSEQGLKLPQGALLNQRFKNMSAEAVYDILYRENFNYKNGNSLEEKLTTWDDHSRWCNGQQVSSAKQKVQISAWKMKVTQAAQMNKVRGNLPAGIEKLIENILYPKLDWKQALASFVQPTRFDYTFLPPDRRFDYVFLPEFGSEGLENIVVALDTSGSVWNYATEFMSELIGIVHSYPDFKGYVAMCDTKTVFDELTPDYTPKKFIGGGGTNFRSLFEKVDNYGIDPSLMVFLTDGKALFPKIPPNYPVLWVLINENCPTPPFGSVAYMNLD